MIRYGLSDTYDITYYISRERVLDEEELIKFKESEKYNPTLQIKFSLTDRNGNPLSDRFVIYDGLNQRFIESGIDSHRCRCGLERAGDREDDRPA